MRGCLHDLGSLGSLEGIRIGMTIEFEGNRLYVAFLGRREPRILTLRCPCGDKRKRTGLISLKKFLHFVYCF